MTLSVGLPKPFYSAYKMSYVPLRLLTTYLSCFTIHVIYVFRFMTLFYGFFKLLDKIIQNEPQYIKDYEKQREYLLDKYYNLSNTKSVENYKIFLKNIMGVNKNYEE